MISLRDRVLSEDDQVSRIFRALIVALVAVRPAAADGVMLVDRGPVLLGSDRDDPSEAPAHRLHLEQFYIHRFKVTNRQVAEFLEARGLRSQEGEDYYDADDADARIHRVTDASGRRVWRADAGWEDHPAVEVSWFGARDYCRWKSMRLPTEAEWEKAARGDDGRRYPWGDEPPTPDRAVYGRAYNATQPAGGRSAGASPHAVQDMVGNLREWTSSQYRPYPYRPGDGREGGERTAARVVRGASHDDPPGDLRVTLRRYYEHRGAARGHHHVGFRCATSEDLARGRSPSREER
jgi:formylglycine-generating enzyme required for sulfatase activity